MKVHGKARMPIIHLGSAQGVGLYFRVVLEQCRGQCFFFRVFCRCNETSEVSYQQNTAVTRAYTLFSGGVGDMARKILMTGRAAE